MYVCMSIFWAGMSSFHTQYIHVVYTYVFIYVYIYACIAYNMSCVEMYVFMSIFWADNSIFHPVYTCVYACILGVCMLVCRHVRMNEYVWVGYACIGCMYGYMQACMNE